MDLPGTRLGWKVLLYAFYRSVHAAATPRDAALVEDATDLFTRQVRHPIGKIIWYAAPGCPKDGQQLFYNVPPQTQQLPDINQCEAGLPPFTDTEHGGQTKYPLPFAPASFTVTNASGTCDGGPYSQNLDIVRLFADCQRKRSGVQHPQYYCPDTCEVETWSGGDKYNTCVNTPKFKMHGKAPAFSVIYDIGDC